MSLPEKRTPLSLKSSSPRTVPANRAYLPKIKTSTAKTVAQNILRNTSGAKTISSTKFKNFLKSEKDLKRYAYAPKTGHLAKQQAKKFFDKVVSAAKGRTDMKVSAIAAKKIGVRLGREGTVSDIGLNKMFRTAAAQDITASQPTGPSPEDIKREEKRQTMLKTIHKWERANETEAADKNTGNKPSEKQPEQRAALPTFAGGSGAAAAGSQKAGDSNPAPSGPIKGTAVPASTRIPILILPLTNLTATVSGTKALAKKIDATITQTIRSFSECKVILLSNPSSRTSESPHAIAVRAGAHLCLSGSIACRSEATEITILLHRTEDRETVQLVSLREHGLDTFGIQRKVIWHLTDAFRGSSESHETEGPAADLAIDLPI